MLKKTLAFLLIATLVIGEAPLSYSASPPTGTQTSHFSQQALTGLLAFFFKKRELGEQAQHEVIGDVIEVAREAAAAEPIIVPVTIIDFLDGETPDENEIRVAAEVNSWLHGKPEEDFLDQPVSAEVLHLHAGNSDDKVLFVGQRAWKTAIALALNGRKIELVVEPLMKDTLFAWLKKTGLDERIHEKGGRLGLLDHPSEVNVEGGFRQVSLVDFIPIVDPDARDLLGTSKGMRELLRQQLLEPLSTWANPGTVLYLGSVHQVPWLLKQFEKWGYTVQIDGPVSGEIFGGLEPIYRVEILSVPTDNHHTLAQAVRSIALPFFASTYLFVNGLAAIVLEPSSFSALIAAQMVFFTLATLLTSTFFNGGLQLATVEVGPHQRTRKTVQSAREFIESLQTKFSFFGGNSGHSGEPRRARRRAAQTRKVTDRNFEKMEEFAHARRGNVTTFWGELLEVTNPHKAQSRMAQAKKYQYKIRTSHARRSNRHSQIQSINARHSSPRVVQKSGWSMGTLFLVLGITVTGILSFMWLLGTGPFAPSYGPISEESVGPLIIAVHLALGKIWHKLPHQKFQALFTRSA